MTIVREIVTKAKINDRILRVISPISMMERSMDVMATRKERQRLPKEVVATYVVGRMAMQDAPS